MLWRGILRCCQLAVDLAVTAALLLCGSFGLYGLWDNQQVLTSAADVQAELLRWKPVASAEAETPDNSENFAQLRMINPEVRGWITMEGTGIDFPVLQGRNNMSYINRDFFGNFSLAGSIFLDSRDDPEFEEGYALLYGHHMADGNMFGDLDKYREEAFFREHSEGRLILPDREYRLDVVACLVVPASEKMIFDPDYVRQNPEAWETFVTRNAALLREENLEGQQYLALTTCSSEFTDARTVVLTQMEGVRE